MRSLPDYGMVLHEPKSDIARESFTLDEGAVELLSCASIHYLSSYQRHIE